MTTFGPRAAEEVQAVQEHSEAGQIGIKQMTKLLKTTSYDQP